MFVIAVVIQLTQWDQDTLENIVVSLSILEDIASSIFEKVDNHIDKSINKMREIESVINPIDLKSRDA